nr:unnamed protein product [Callosobruchus chinensis]
MMNLYIYEKKKINLTMSITKIGTLKTICVLVK